MKKFNRFYERIRYIRNFFFCKIFRFKHVQYSSYIATHRQINRGIRVGEYSFIAKDCRITIPIRMGNYVMVSKNVAILGSDHYSDVVGIPMIFTGRPKIKPVVIEDDVWIGYRSIILEGVTLGEGCIVGAGAVVTKDVEPYTIVGSVPAKYIKHRFSDKQIKKHKKDLQNRNFNRTYNRSKNMKY